MKYFFDTEFIEDGKTIDLISIGVVAEDGRELYMLNTDCDYDKASDWVQGNVLVYIPYKPTEFEYNATYIGKGWYRHECIGSEIVKFCDIERYGKPEFWAYYADYDWVAFCQLFGTMMDLPDGFPMYCNDLIQLLDSLPFSNVFEDRSIDITYQIEGKHNALEDARWVKDTYFKALKWQGSNA